MNESFQHKTILVGVSAGISAYKIPTLVSQLRKEGADVQVLMTPDATQFIQPLTFAALTRKRVITNIFPDSSTEGDHLFPHLYPSSYADVFIVAPATADIIADLAHGKADNILSATALALPSHCLKFFCPAMNTRMWTNEATQDNVKILESRGWIRIGPEEGILACAEEGPGRMSEPTTIYQTVKEFLLSPLIGHNILILSGPTREPIDSVRFISNHSSGLMGKALAECLDREGATIYFVTGPVHPYNLPRGRHIHHIHVETAEEMLQAAQNHFHQCHLIIFVAAVADFRPQNPTNYKIEKKKLNKLLVEPTPDIAASLTQHCQSHQICIGFALQDHDGENRAREKLIQKRLNAIILNTPSSFGSTEGEFTFITREYTEKWGHLSKAMCALRITQWYKQQITKAGS